jgi:hypothetical protein
MTEADRLNMKAQRLPSTESIQELAQFWDTHDLTDFDEFLEEVSEPVFVRARDATLTIDLTPREAQRVKRIARRRGVDETTTVRQWILEKLHESSASARRRVGADDGKTRRGGRLRSPFSK